jgi:hypothetical protein
MRGRQAPDVCNAFATGLIVRSADVTYLLRKLCSQDGRTIATFLPSRQISAVRCGCREEAACAAATKSAEATSSVASRIPPSK